MIRYDLLDLSQVPVPDAVRSVDFDAAYAGWLGQYRTEAARYGVVYDVSRLRSDPAGWAMRVGAYRDITKRAEINDAVRAVLLASATGADLDNVVADFPIARKVLVPADATAVPPAPAVMEGDDDLRLRRALAPEALSVAGPNGAYRFYAYDAHPDVKDVGVYGPESGLVADGRVMLVVLSKSAAGGRPSRGVLLAVADKLGAWDCPDVPGYIRPTPAQLDANDLRPNTAWVTVRAATVTPYAVAGVLRVPPGADGEVLRLEAQARIVAYAAARNRVGKTHTMDSLIAAGRMLAADGNSPVTGFRLTLPTADVDPGPLGAAWLESLVRLSVEVSDG